MAAASTADKFTGTGRNKRVPYQQAIKTHLGNYKRERLRIDEDGEFNYRGKLLHLPHILPAEEYRKNILKPFRAEFWQYLEAQRPPIKLHRFFHHLNSSQAMCFNLFFPLLAPEYHSLLLKSLGMEIEPVEQLRFEHIEDPAEATNFDFFIRLRSGRRLFFELKFSEQEFGSVRNPSKAHLEKRKKIYLPRLRDEVLDVYRKPEYIFGYYQIVRNISYLSYNSPDHLFFIFPKANRAIRREEEAIHVLCSHMLNKSITVLYLEDLALTIADEADEIGGKLAENYGEFVEKYVL